MGSGLRPCRPAARAHPDPGENPRRHPAVRMKQPLTLARRRALRNLHGSREEKTLARLGEALNRMEAGSPQRIAAPFRWTKANLAREADVHITTILFKEENGSYRYAGI